MARDDSVLYGGSSSASFGTTHSEKQRKDIVEDKKEKRGQLRPVAKIVFDEIKAEMNSVMYVPNIDVESATDERLFMIEVMARKKYVQYLKQLQNKLDNILRERK